MERVKQATSATIAVTFTIDGEASDPSPDTATIRIVRDDGTEVVATTAATPNGVGRFEYTLTPTHTAELDWLTAHWTATIGGEATTVTTLVEIVGGFLFTLARARQDTDLSDEDTYSTDRLIEARTYAEQELEQACGLAFVPRYYRGSLRYNDRVVVHPHLRALRSVTRDATSYATTNVTWGSDGIIDLHGTVPAATTGNTGFAVAYEHGLDQPPVAVTHAAIALAKDYLVNGPVDDRAIQRITEDGPIFIATPGYQGKRFGIPAVDAVVTAYRYRRSRIGSITLTA